MRYPHLTCSTILVIPSLATGERALDLIPSKLWPCCPRFNSNHWISWLATIPSVFNRTFYRDDVPCRLKNITEYTQFWLPLFYGHIENVRLCVSYSIDDKIIVIETRNIIIIRKRGKKTLSVWPDLYRFKSRKYYGFTARYEFSNIFYIVLYFFTNTFLGIKRSRKFSRSIIRYRILKFRVDSIYPQSYPQ